MNANDSLEVYSHQIKQLVMEEEKCIECGKTFHCPNWVPAPLHERCNKCMNNNDSYNILDKTLRRLAERAEVLRSLGEGI